MQEIITKCSILYATTLLPSYWPSLIYTDQLMLSQFVVRLTSHHPYRESPRHTVVLLVLVIFMVFMVSKNYLDGSCLFVFLSFCLSAFLSFRLSAFCISVFVFLSSFCLSASHCILVHLSSLEVDSDQSEACLDD